MPKIDPIVFILTIFLISYTIINTVKLIYYIYKNKNKSNKNDNIIIQTLSFNQCEEILSYIIDDIYKNKYYLQYRLRDVSVIPKMKDEIRTITEDIYNSMSNNLKLSFSLYYTDEYLITSITRRVQILLVEYTNTYKPPTK